MTSPEYQSSARTLASQVMLYENRYQNFSCPPHFHETFQIELVDAGWKSCHHKGSSYHRIRKGAVLLVNPYEIHTGGNDGESELVCKAYYPSFDDWESLPGESFRDGRTEKRKVRFKQLLAWDHQLVAKVHRLFMLDPSSEELLVKELYQEIMCYLWENYMTDAVSFDENARRYSAAMRRGIEYINDNLSEKLLLDDIARASFISPFHFLRLFKKLNGISLHQYVLSLKVERAKKILLQQRNIQLASIDLGFTDQAHFTRIFKKITGLTPKQYMNVEK